MENNARKRVGLGIVVGNPKIIAKPEYKTPEIQLMVVVVQVTVI